MDEQTIRLLLRMTARLSLAFFLCAFGGGALYRLWPAALTRWLAEARCRATLGLGASHTLHLAAILALAINLGREPFLHEVRWAGLMGGAIGFLFIYGLGADALLRGRVAWLASPRFQAVAHYLLWGIFALAFVGRALHSMFYLPFALALLAAFAVRLCGRAATKRKSAPAGPRSSKFQVQSSKLTPERSSIRGVRRGG